MIRVALIFDDGPHTGHSGKILTVLAQRSIHATFGQVAQNAREHPVLVERVTAEGHEIANHSLAHRRPSELDDMQLKQEVAGAQRIFEELDVRPAWYWPPFLERDERLRNITEDIGIQVYGPRHLVDSGDYMRELSADQIVTRATTGVRDGSVILFHEWRNETVERLPQILDTLTDRGCVFMTFSRLNESLNTSEQKARKQPADH